MKQKKVWSILKQANVKNNLQDATKTGQSVADRLELAMNVMRPLLTDSHGNLIRNEYDESVPYVTSYLTASNAEICRICG